MLAPPHLSNALFSMLSHANANAINRGKKRYHRLCRLGPAKCDRLREREKKKCPIKKSIDKYIRGEHINNKYKEIFIYTFFFWWYVDGDSQVYDGAKRLSIISAWDAGSVIKNGFRLCSFTLNFVLLLRSTITTTPCGKTMRTMNSPDQRVLSFSAKM